MKKGELCRIVILCCILLGLIWHSTVIECDAEEAACTLELPMKATVPGDTLTMAVVYMTFAPVATEEVDSNLVDYWDDFEDLRKSWRGAQSVPRCF